MHPQNLRISLGGLAGKVPRQANSRKDFVEIHPGEHATLAHLMVHGRASRFAEQRFRNPLNSDIALPFVAQARRLGKPARRNDGGTGCGKLMDLLRNCRAQGGQAG